MIFALLVLSVIVVFHEFGHYLLARLNGIAVVEFSVGFGPRLLSWESKKSGTRYSWKLIPFGGSCAMLGSFDEETETEEEKAYREKYADGCCGVSFFEKSALRRMSVIAAGPIFNFILALIAAVFVISWAGYDAPVLLDVTAGEAADAAGLQAGDKITKIGGRRMLLTRDCLLYMMTTEKEDIAIEYERMDESSGVWNSYETVIDGDQMRQEGGRYYMGVSFSAYRVEAESIPALIRYAVADVRYNVISVVESLKMMFGGRLTGEEIAGPVRIVSIIDQTVEQAAPGGLISVIMQILNLIVVFSANLGVMNLIPFPALDGGRLVFLLWELVTGRPVNQKVEGMISLIGMALLMALMFLVIFNDIRILY